MFEGAFTALITPFKNGEVDWTAFENLVEWQIEQGIHGLVACGTTGESPCLSKEEHSSIVKRCVDMVKGRVPVIAGTGTNNTISTIAATEMAKLLGADAALIVAPYYNKPSQEGLYQHYKAVNDSVSLPVIIYNIPGRSIVDINVETMGRLAQLPNMVGIKDATGDLERPALTKQLTGDNFCQLTGEDATTLAFLGQGGHGSISVTSNIAPKLCAEVYNLWKTGKIEEAKKIDTSLQQLHKDLFLEPSPAPVKYAANLLGLCENELRLPLVKATEHCETAVKAAMIQADLISDQGQPILQAHG